MDVYTTILKIPGLESFIETSAKSGGDVSAFANGTETEEGMKIAHQSECEFYSNLAPALDAPISKVFKTQLWTEKQKGCIHMEDLTRRGDFTSILGKYRKIFKHPDMSNCAYTQAYKDQKITPVIVHGYMHSENIMWEINENGDVQNNIGEIVDWHTIFEGSPMFGLARFLSICGSGVVRRQAEVFALDYYLECLIKEFNGDVSKVPYTAEQLKESYNYGFLTQIIGVVGGGIFMMETLKGVTQALSDAYFDEIVLKTLMVCEDGARLMKREMKDVFEKYSF
uniref:CHK kinase-like domain-containing protein n=1 Tax=Panagrolaimus sp. ES5 TaxID=591445 RepID=A0AC34F9E7_9BILA